MANEYKRNFSADIREFPYALPLSPKLGERAG
jgi:hypothetical protein